MFNLQKIFTNIKYNVFVNLTFKRLYEYVNNIILTYVS